MKLNNTVKKAISAFGLLLAAAGLYGAAIALCNQYLRRQDLLTPTSKFILVAFIIAGFYLIFRQFCRRIDAIGKR